MSLQAMKLSDTGQQVVKSDGAFRILSKWQGTTQKSQDTRVQSRAQLPTVSLFVLCLRAIQAYRACQTHLMRPTDLNRELKKESLINRTDVPITSCEGMGILDEGISASLGLRIK